MKKFTPQPGFTVLAHKLALDPNATANRHLHSHGGAARAAYNWAVAYVTAVWWQRKAEQSYGICEDELTQWRSWSLPSLRKAFNEDKRTNPRFMRLVGGELQGGIQHRSGRRVGCVRQLCEVEER